MPLTIQEWAILLILLCLVWAAWNWFYMGRLAKRRYDTILLLQDRIRKTIEVTSGWLTYIVAAELVRKYVELDYTHRSGRRLSQYSDDEILVHAACELQELREAPLDIEELGDTIACLIHYQLRRNWSQTELALAISRKLQQRLSPSAPTTTAGGP